MKIRSILAGFAVLGFLVLANGCSTTIAVTVTRPAELDLAGARSISVLPIGYGSPLIIDADYFKIVLARSLGFIEIRNLPEAKVARYLEGRISDGLLDAPYFTVIDAGQIQRYLKDPQGEPPAQVYLTAEIREFHTWISDESRTRKLKDKEGKEQVEKYPVWSRKVEMNLEYRVIDARNHQIIARRSQSISGASGYFENQGSIPSADTLLGSRLDQVARQILREIQPYDVTLHLSLLPDGSKDPDMETADQMVKDKDYGPGLKLYLDIYRRTGNFAAGYNASWLQFALGKLEAARDLMQELLDSSGDPRARQALQQLEREINSQNQLDAQLAN